MSPAILTLHHVNSGYDRRTILHQISFEIQKGQIVSLIGTNGAGKTTLLKTIAGLIPVQSGTIRYNEKPLDKLSPFERARQRISLVPEGRGIFVNLTVQENLQLGSWIWNRMPDEEELERIFVYFPRLKERFFQSAATLSGGEQQMLAIGRALLSKPHLLILDEPSLGLAPKFIERIFSIISDINKTGVTILLVEQNAKQALQIAQVGIILENGRIVANKNPIELLQSDIIRKVYLGEF
jgi:branched-chain amino acid transport system ATP-binding protein